MPQAITPTLRFARRGLACSILLFAACVAPRQGEVGTVADFDVLLNEGGAEVVQGNLTGDPLDPSDHPAPVPTAEDVSRMLAGVAEAQKEPEPEPEPDPGLSAEAQAELELLDLYIRFGERIIPARMPDGTIFVTKPYIMPVGKAEKVKLLIHALEPFPWGPRPEAKELPDQPGVLQRAPQNPEVVCWELLPKWDEEYYGVLSSGNVGAPPAAPGVVSLGDAFIITAVPDLLEQFEAFIDLFGQVPQIELEAKIIEIVETDTTDFGIKGFPGVPIFQFGTRNFVNAFDFNLGNQEGSTEALLTLGALQDGTTFNAIIEAVQRWDNVSVETKPKTIVRAGGTARLESTQRIPYLEVTSISSNGQPNTRLAFLEVGTKLYISPRVVGSQVLALDVQLSGSQAVGSQVTFTTGGQGYNVPVLATRQARSLVYLKPGQTLLIGGLTRDRIQQTQSKIPILGDIPFIGFFFRNKYDVHEKEHVIFAISPRIVQQGDFDIDF